MTISMRWRFIVMILVDTVLINLAFILSLYYGYSFNIPKQYLDGYISNTVLMVLIYAVIFVLFGIYKSLWTFAGTDEFLIVLAGIATAGFLNSIACSLLGIGLPLRLNILATILSAMLVCGFRIIFRIYRRVLIKLNWRKKERCIRVMIIGAGSAGALLLKEMKSQKDVKYKAAAVIDDNPSITGTTILGVKVYGDRYKIQQVVLEKLIEIIILAIPSLKSDEKKKLLEICKNTGCKLKIVPRLNEMLDDGCLLNKVRDINVEDLLGREEVKLDMNGILSYIENKVVMVTGGGGSIGSELCRQIVRFNPKQLIIIDAYENNAYDIQGELSFKYPDLNLKVLIATIRDKNRLESIFSRFKPELVFHAAAHKHVPLMEDSPCEAVKNNIFGTLNLSECADKYGVKRFIMISTDKAVNPTNIMGASKRVCEMIIQSMNKVSRTEFVAVRFGNVLGSNGSVIPKFKKQIASGGPVTVTHRKITRFFMTIPEAAQLVLQAGAFAGGGEIFVLNMGEPVRIYDLACDLIRLSGLEPEKDIGIKITGLRPGEKLYEELVMSEEWVDKTRHEKIFVEKPMEHSIEELREKLKVLRNAVGMEDEKQLFYCMAEIVPTYKRHLERDNNHWRIDVNDRSQ